MEENGSGKDKLKDLTRCNRDGLVVVMRFFSVVLRVEVMKIVPIMRFKKQKRTGGVNQLATDSIMLSLLCASTAQGKVKRVMNEENLWLQLQLWGCFYSIY